MTVRIANRAIGHSEPCYIVAEIGINHTGDLEIAKRLIEVAKQAGCDGVKFQKRTLELCVPPEYADVKRDTPWGVMTGMEYRRRLEFSEGEYAEIDRYCRELGIQWFSSCWDEQAVDCMEQFEPVCYKVASASITNTKLIDRLVRTDRPIVLSTGMSTMSEIDRAVSRFNPTRLIILHTTSTYPCRPEEINLNMIRTLRDRYDCPIGYSGHEVGLQISLAAIAIGACVLERHITLDRAHWGSDQAASVEPQGLVRLVRDVRVIERAMGDGVKKVYDSEMPIRKKLRGE